MSGIPRLNPKLPSKLSKLMRVALNDLAFVEANPKYKVDMEEWHANRFDDDKDHYVCHVCFAGSVISQTCGMQPNEYFVSEKFKDETWMRLDALNEIRCGNIEYALQELQVDSGKIAEVVDKLSLYNETPLQVTPYEEDRERFRQDMETIVGFLESEGL